MKELTLFENHDFGLNKTTIHKKGTNDGYKDYDSFIKKFTFNPKTTDECWTPQDVYEAVVKYVGSVYDMTGKQVIRPFYPGGDYINTQYPDNGVVIDNPPFSIFSKICKFYTASSIPFFLFGPGLTISDVCSYCTAVIVSPSIKFQNGAVICCNFATNLLGDKMMTTAVSLSRDIENCPSQLKPVKLAKYEYPEEVLSVSKFQTIARGNEDFCVTSEEAVVIRRLVNGQKGGLFGTHLLATRAAARAAGTTKIELSESEKRIVDELDKRCKDYEKDCSTNS